MARIPEFYKLSVSQRVRAVRKKGLLSNQDYQALVSGEHTLSIQSADKMIENVIGVMGLPVGLGLNFLINGKEYAVPLVVEEPSIVAALSSAAKIARAGGGFRVESTEPILIGQIQVVDVPHPQRAKAAILQRKSEILNLANSLHPNMVARGGGAKDLEVLIHPSSGQGGDMVVVHLMVDTRDAMGANLVNTMCEGVASLVENIAEGKVFLRILSNLTDRAMVKAHVSIPLDALAGKGFDGEQVRDGIVLANEFASIDPYRAATHNKGIMNGIDAMALATGNDWRAIEAGAHAWAARGSHYASLTQWTVGEDGSLVGQLEIPLKVGIVGGPLQSNPTVGMNLRLLGVSSARELAEVMGAVGLAQNFSAVRALVTEGIQQGHMTLHARTVVAAAGAAPEIFETVVDRLIESGEIKVWKARELIDELGQPEVEAAGEDESESADREEPRKFSGGHGKIILLGEHAVVYGRHAIATPIPLAIQAHVERASDGVELIIPRWGVEQRLHRNTEKQHSFEKSLALIFKTLGLEKESMRVEIFPNVPRAMGLGGSAAIAVATIRALDRCFDLGLDDEQVNALAFECEKIAHGTPSGIDNTLSVFGETMLFRSGDEPLRKVIELPHPVDLVVGISGIESLTAATVARVRKAREAHPSLYNRIFDQIDSLVLQGVDALVEHDLPTLGELMNVCQGLLNAMQVSSWELEEMIQIARRHGALGAKLTGGGGGGSIIALCPEEEGAAQRIEAGLKAAGYQAMQVTIGGELSHE
ncbi:MAG: hydroxymethylglutaryl-CoA reductase, degradative [Wenzhouxiangellaceae bacterium]|nr:hydroxymethylglutaryl-CoA reductase, degradative [Wenzhouxiangellaceae bacterium]